MLQVLLNASVLAQLCATKRACGLLCSKRAGIPWMQSSQRCCIM